jgi:branched-chain amino acid transport system substrate-binding protein
MAEAEHMGQVEQSETMAARRKILHLAVMSTALFIAGCKVVPKGPPKPIDQPPVTGPGDGLPTDNARHRVALLVPLMGPNAQVGESIANAANMAVLDTGGQKIRLTVYDTSVGAAVATSRAIAEGNKLILGPLLAEDVRAAVDLGRKARVPLISFSNDTSVAGNGVYILGFTPGQSMERVVNYARSQGKTRFSAIAPVGIYGERALAGFRLAVNAAGGKLVAAETYDRNTGGMLGAIARVNKFGTVDAILIADGGKVAVQMVPILRRNGNPSAQILGTELWNTDSSLASASALQGAWFASVSDGVYNQLATKYRTRFGKAPYRLASLGYDSILLVTKVSNSWKVGTPFPLTLLEDRGGFTGIDGPFRFGSSGIAERALEVQKVSPKGATIISPAIKVFPN